MGEGLLLAIMVKVIYYIVIIHYYLVVKGSFKWIKEYIGSIQLNPSEELAKIPPHSSLFIFDHENRYSVVILENSYMQQVSSSYFSLFVYHFLPF